ncbi:hypothetical protein N9230_05705, partial [Akkermansiaceae bacterium]|nr:hypothetical protein [Akkermansiaceae bacterium]
MTKIRNTILSLFLAASSFPAFGQEAYRTDQNKDPKLPWFQPVNGEFPPEGSAHYVSGELIGLDHPERKIILRVDRNDRQERALMDYPLTASMLPYGSIYYLNQPAA